jgi:hypothetical protein
MRTLVGDEIGVGTVNGEEVGLGAEPFLQLVACCPEVRNSEIVDLN